MTDNETIEATIGSKETLGKVRKIERMTKDRTANRKIKVLELHAKDLTQYEICKTTGLSASTVKKTIEKFSKVFTDLKRVDEYRSIKANLLSAAQLTALESAMSGNKLAKAGFLSTLQGFDILNKAERLETGKSTENHAHSHFGRISVTNKTSDSNDLP